MIIFISHSIIHVYIIASMLFLDFHCLLEARINYNFIMLYIY